MPTNFDLVADMNVAFGNPSGDPKNIDWNKVRKQTRSIAHEFAELQIALGASKEAVAEIVKKVDALTYENELKLPARLDAVRDALTDIHVFAYGAHHLMGIDANLDMQAVIGGVMTRFIKDADDQVATLAKHKAAGVEQVYFEGEFPTMVMKSAVDQPDAPQGKFLKSASYKEPVFYDIR